MATLPQNVLDLLASDECASEVAESVAAILGWSVSHGDGWSAVVSPDGTREIRGTVVDATTTTWLVIDRSEQFATWTDSDLRAVCRANDPNGDFDDCTRADLVAMLAGWMAEEPDYWRARLGGAS